MRRRKLKESEKQKSAERGRCLMKLYQTKGTALRESSRKKKKLHKNREEGNVAERTKT